MVFMVHFLLTGRYTVYGLSSFIGHNREKETHIKCSKNMVLVQVIIQIFPKQKH